MTVLQLGQQAQMNVSRAARLSPACVTRVVGGLASDKCEGPQTCVEYLGFELDTIKDEIRLPEEKLQQLETLLQSWEGKKSCTEHELDSLIGQLQHATKNLAAHS